MATASIAKCTYHGSCQGRSDTFHGKLPDLSVTFSGYYPGHSSTCTGSLPGHILAWYLAGPAIFIGTVSVSFGLLILIAPD